MATFSQEQIEAVKRAVDLVALVRASGVELERKGLNWVGRCPFHEDASPSLVVTPSKGLWNCLGACRNNGHPSGGDALGWLVRFKKLSFPEAMKELGAVAPASAKAEPSAEPPARPSPELLSTVVAHYHGALLASKETRAYLESRKLWDPRLIGAFKIGYADGSLLERLGTSPLKKDLRTLGVLTGSGRELLSGCIVVPILKDGQVVNLYGRHIEKPQHLYLPGHRQGLFSAQGAKDAARLVLCESIFDALSLLILGEPGAFPLWGVNGWTPDHEAFLKGWTGKELVLALDSDEAGKAASALLAERLAAYKPRVLNLSPHKDPNELLCRAQDAKETWASLAAPPKIEDAAKEEKRAAPERLPSEDSDGFSFTFEDRRYSVRGLSSYGLDRLKVTVKLAVNGSFHLDSLDLYSARARDHYAEAAAKLLSTDASKVARDLLTLSDRLEKLRLQRKDEEKESAPALSASEREEALALLKDPNLLDRVLADLEKLGCVGEREALALGYLGTVSRLLDKPLGLIILARSGAGKTTIQDAVTDLVPEESLVKYTRITGQALFYKEEDALVHKVLAIEEDAGAEAATYAIKNLQSSQVLTIAATRTDPATGRHQTDAYRVKGPVFIMLTTTNPHALDFETRNRFLEVTVDESHEQTARILKAQREEDTLEGLLRQAARERIMRLHQNAQRLLRPLKVMNPFAGQLIYPAHGLKARREQKKYLTLLKAMALLHQYQRPVKRAERDGISIEYVEITREDLDSINSLGRFALARGLDELSPMARSLYREIQGLIAAKREKLQKDLPPGMPAPEPSVCRKDLTRGGGWGYWHLRVYLKELCDKEYLGFTYNGTGRRAHYVVLDDAEDEEPSLTIRLKEGENLRDSAGFPPPED
jgi:DNA primase catalytic core